MVIVTAPSFIRHSTIALATQIHETVLLLTLFTVVLQKTETNDIMGLCVKATNSVN